MTRNVVTNHLLYPSCMLTFPPKFFRYLNRIPNLLTCSDITLNVSLTEIADITCKVWLISTPIADLLAIANFLIFIIVSEFNEMVKPNSSNLTLRNFFPNLKLLLTLPIKSCFVSYLIQKYLRIVK